VGPPVKGRADALYVCADALLNALRTRINTLALGARLPAVYNFREPVEVGSFMSYGANVPDLFRRAGDLVDKILRGAKPEELPVEQPTKFDLVINLTTATALGLTIPEAVLLRADEVIEWGAASSSRCSAARQLHPYNLCAGSVCARKREDSQRGPQPESAGSRSSREMERALRSERPPPSCLRPSLRMKV
jgi:hypothetical protein